MFIGLNSFRGGETLSKLVSPDAAKKMRLCGGWSIRNGAATPENVPTRVSTTALGGAAQACTVTATTDVVAATGHGFVAGSQIEFGSTTGGVSTGTTYFVISSGLGDNAFKFSTTYGGSAFNITSDGSNTVWGRMPEQVPVAFRDSTGTRIIARDHNENLRVMAVAGTWGSALDAMDVVADNIPIRLGSYVGFATEGSASKLMAFEPDSATTTTRPLSLKGPCDYSSTTKPVVTASAASGLQLFDLAEAETNNPDSHFEAVTGYVDHIVGEDYEILGFNEDTTADALHFKMDLGATGVDLTGKKYLVMDIGLTWSQDDPNTLIVNGGDFVNSDQTARASGWVLVLYTDQACTTELRRYTIPQLQGNLAARFSTLRTTRKGVASINRVVFHLGTLSSYTVKGIGIRTASYFVNSIFETASFSLWIYSQTFAANWEFAGNYLMPAVTWKWSPWYDQLPPDPGALGTSATVLESFPASLDNFSPDHPTARYVYVFRGKDALSVDNYYTQMLSNPSLASTDFFADPWSTYSIAITLPSDDGATVITEYGDYVTHALLYKQDYDGLGEDAEVGELGIWSDYKYVGRMAISGSMTYTDQGQQDVDCAFTVTTNVITSTDHLLNVGDCVSFTHTVGGVTEGQIYFVLTVPNGNTFTVSDEPEGTVVTLTTVASGDQHWSAESPELSLDDHDIPEILEVNHDYADSAKMAAVADGRVYAAHLTWDNSSETWLRPLQMMVSNYNDFGSFPTTPSDDFIDTDGQELAIFAPDSTEIISLLVKNDVKYVHTDTGFYELVGRDSARGWEFLRRDRIRAVTARTVADCRSAIMWHDGAHFYKYGGELAEPVSENEIDSSLIDFTKAHGFVFSKERYVGFCYLNDPAESTPWCLLTYDLVTGAWQRRHSTAYELAGICVADSSGTVYGLTHDGDVVNIFGGTTEYGAASTTWTLDTQYIETPDAREHHTSHLVAKALTDEATLDLTVNIYSRGRLNDSELSRTLAIVSTRQNYLKGDLDVDLTGDAFRIVLTYTGSAPPTIFKLGLELDDTPREDS